MECTVSQPAFLRVLQVVGHKEASAHGVKTMRGRDRRTRTWPLDSYSLHPPGASQGAPGHVPRPVILSWTTYTLSLCGVDEQGGVLGRAPTTRPAPKPPSAPPTKHRPLPQDSWARTVRRSLSAKGRWEKPAAREAVLAAAGWPLFLVSPGKDLVGTVSTSTPPSQLPQGWLQA